MSEWIAYATLRGMPEDRADARSASLCALTANIHRKPDSEAIDPQAFMPGPIAPDEPEEAEPPAPTMADLGNASDAMRRLIGGKPRGDAR